MTFIGSNHTCLASRLPWHLVITIPNHFQWDQEGAKKRAKCRLFATADDAQWRRAARHLGSAGHDQLPDGPLSTYPGHLQADDESSIPLTRSNVFNELVATGHRR